jgi:hypothetical protein
VGRLSTGNLKQLRAQLGNEIAIKAYREGKLPFPDGAIIAALHWNEVSSDENHKVLASAPSIVAGADPYPLLSGPRTRKSTRRRMAGGSPPSNGKPGDEALHKTCYPATSLAKTATWSSRVTRLLLEEARAIKVRCRGVDPRRNCSSAYCG